MNAGLLIFALVIGFAGYREAARFQQRYGRSPFGWPAIVWGVVCFLSFLIGAVLLAIAERIGRKAAEKTPVYGGSYTQPVYAAPGYGAPGYGPPPAYGPPAYAQPVQPPYGPAPQEPPAYGPPPQQPPAYGPPPLQSRPFNGDILPK